MAAQESITKRIAEQVRTEANAFCVTSVTEFDSHRIIVLSRPNVRRSSENYPLSFFICGCGIDPWYEPINEDILISRLRKDERHYIKNLMRKIVANPAMVATCSTDRTAWNSLVITRRGSSFAVTFTFKIRDRGPPEQKMPEQKMEMPERKAIKPVEQKMPVVELTVIEGQPHIPCAPHVQYCLEPSAPEPETFEDAIG